MSGTSDRGTGHTAAAPGAAGEPSMEDILASIRRILSEDEPLSSPNEASAAAHDAERHEAGHDEVLELDPSMIVEDPYETMPMSGDRRAATDAPLTQPAISAPVPQPMHETPMHETPMHEAPMHEAPPVPDAPVYEPPVYQPPAYQPPAYQPPVYQAPVDAALVPAPKPHEPAPAAASPVEWAAEPAPVPPVSAAPHVHTLGQPSMEQPVSSTPYVPAPSSETVDEDLVAPSAAAGVASSVGELLRAVAAKREPIPVQRNGPTIEDLVREEMRPLLKAWLDTNLPPLVERLVRVEIERVVTRAF